MEIFSSLIIFFVFLGAEFCLNYRIRETEAKPSTRDYLDFLIFWPLIVLLGIILFFKEKDKIGLASFTLWLFSGCAIAVIFSPESLKQAGLNFVLFFAISFVWLVIAFPAGLKRAKKII